MATLASLFLRICLVGISPFSSLDKIFNGDGAFKQANSGILSGAPVPSSTPPYAVTPPGYR